MGTQIWICRSKVEEIEDLQERGRFIKDLSKLEVYKLQQEKCDE